MTHDELLRRNAESPRPAPVTSARDARSSGVPHASSDACAAGFFDNRRGRGESTSSQPGVFARLRGTLRRSNAWRLVAVVYVMVALAAPVLLYAGPEVLSPAALTIAGDALHGELPLHLH